MTDVALVFMQTDGWPGVQDISSANMILLVMGVSGCGKSTIGKKLSEEMSWPFEDGDDYHPESNRLKMSSGIPLNDEDRYQWLLNLNTVIKRWEKTKQDGIVVCSALKSKYRQVLISGRNANYFGTYSNTVLDTSPSDITMNEGEIPPGLQKVDATQVNNAITTAPADTTCDKPEYPKQNEATAALQSVSQEQNEQHGTVLFLHLKGSLELITSRLSERKGHFFNPQLLQSQFDTLEDLQPHESGLVVDIQKTAECIVTEVVAHIADCLRTAGSTSTSPTG